MSVASWVRACRGVGASDRVLAGDSCLSRDESVSRKRTRHTLFPSVHPSEPGVGIRSCPAFSRGRTPASDPLLFSAAVKKMAPSSREAIGPEVPDEGPFSAPSQRESIVQKFRMRAYSLVSAGVPRMRLCSSFFVVQHSTCDPRS